MQIGDAFLPYQRLEVFAVSVVLIAALAAISSTIPAPAGPCARWRRIGTRRG